MKEKLKSMQVALQERLETIANTEDLAALYREVLGKKGELTKILKGLAGLSPEEKREMGQLANQLRDQLSEAFKKKESELLDAQSLLSKPIDLSLPGIELTSGALHPTTQMLYDLNDAFRSLNFDVYEGPMISSEAAEFDRLNFPPGHPARESMDTYWLDQEAHGPEQHLCLRPHLTGASVRYLREHGAPARFVYPGRVFRNESTDAGHDRVFTQYEALIVDREISFSSGLLLVKTILEEVFGEAVEVRMRSGFFPFVEPGFEIDMRCRVCHGDGCRVCKNVGWIEVMPGGTPHPNVLRAAGLDPMEWSGFYIDIGLDRLVMMRYGIEDVRHFHAADLRFLEQFQR
ncbi:MAG: phenylalanine--tRNA ligase subunit alpha [Eubacteriales bacterium]|nr:phenylalanine--tRNA ligase subunit alpha [Eubacteriales bacterium]